MLRWIALLVAVVVSACAPAPKPPQVSDGAPLRSISPEEVPAAIPRPDPWLSAGNKTPYTVNGETYEILQDPRSYNVRGIASWYGTKFNGRPTSNGEIFDLYQATAAHKTLPIPSYVEVTNERNGRSIIVRVNDRGPFHSDRVIDLSYGAAVKLGFMAQGTAPVSVRMLNIAGVDDRRGLDGANYRFVQLGAYGAESSAQEILDELGAVVSAPMFISPVQSGNNILYRVRVGPVDNEAQLLLVQEQLQQQGYGPGQPLP